MDATIVPKMQKHYPVLLKEIISVISPQHGGTFIDCTFGQGGYSKKILDFENTKVIAIDRDIESEKIANQLKENFEDRFIFKNIKFSQLNNLKLKNENIRGVIFDLGYSYPQIKDPEKGLSFEANGKLNMQLGLNSYSAEDVINKLDEKELEKIFKFFGDEKMSFTEEAMMLEDQKDSDEISNDLREFGVDSQSPDLFSNDSESSNTDELLSSENEDQEDDLEIPAFLRRQKN